MTFPITVYPLLADQWLAPRNPAGGVADVFNIACQTYISPHAVFPWLLYAGAPTAPNVFRTNPMVLLKFVPGSITLHEFDIIQPDNTVAEYFWVRYFYRFYPGFPQEFLGAWAIRVQAGGGFFFTV